MLVAIRDQTIPGDRVEIRHLRYFVAVAEELHFGRPADRLYVAQPAGSDQIGKLEAVVGSPGFKRTPRPVSLTAAGHALRPQAVRFVRQVGRAQNAVRRASLASRWRLRIGTTTYGPPDQVLWGMSRLRNPASAEVELV
jgi:DNA-binding transcriptional LysR family regulator